MQIKVGDKLIRLLGGEVECKVYVSSIDETNNTFQVMVDDETAEEQRKKIQGLAHALGYNLPFLTDEMSLPSWTFNLSTGLEIDEDLGWDGKTYTGAYIKEFYPDA